ncbi:MULTISPECIES: Holliday junction branch migration protein RuvA [unclassified Lactococcus]|uniref:Holliday junction branch migration protein RuvA n=1 Tax=unclassified Lactococcus TaxID=2643510 RepID=UPI0011CB698C|nr:MULTISPECIES: Holliday junction branch migration protein RuvA [unclassified Lactococcus]MQW23028.1 Holliday junction branch migration protein RuvA [Lactococcus sp. dk101]TXK44373.1 Holliday junction branch migration protein RuvA [Lactococcus sp. dk310]TXK50183.1 Holliday junction branch migration protein RuvA [Lactococcus sp. dk322]
MYEYFNGKLTKITPTYIVVEANGIGYLINVANPYAWSGLMNTVITIYVHQVIREDAHTLYGFTNEAEKALFLRLISVSGIGPKSALAIIAASDNEGLINAIDNNDIKYLTKFPGVGKKTAMQMILDLAGKFDASGSVGISLLDATPAGNIALDEALEALQALGYRASELTKVKKSLQTEPNMTSEEYIKAALKQMMK